MGGGDEIPYNPSTTNTEWNGDTGTLPDINGNHLYGDFFTDNRQRMFWHMVSVHEYTEALGEQQYDSMIMDATTEHGVECVAKVFMHELGHAINAWKGGQPYNDIGYHNPNPDESVMYPWACDSEILDYSQDEWGNIKLDRIKDPK